MLSCFVKCRKNTVSKNPKVARRMQTEEYEK